ncbi:MULTISPECIES: S-layer homology domain-containing protein [unclassified Sporosarcina]|uniref:S-layer homology domain-containing protein n=1 Tax=unclassified Sporosarcina TaxID=2647733 RepID=UPI000C16F9B1|nr:MULTISPECIES: S-layer homology domain-containing protein [unclassified Sporosarcina]PID04969.1 N-acetylmuramoyl-L-alanine amidase [Sporosarcina sp. P30]PID08228.1 N-acetylmuramoyl-L-alanine amidase [Sporosarcina sp. P31]PID11308.1 N-acetylmuramoyl-L-alanine amidase [Sporosarcina sp. P32b]
MTKKSISYVLMAFVLVLQIAVMPLQASAADTEKAPTWITPINYLALGDSLAAGVTPNNELGKGYTDFLAEELAKSEVLQASNKGFSYPGYKTDDVLKDFEMDVTKPIVGIGHSDKTATLHQSVKEAHLITLTIGANDVLPKFTFDDKGTPQFNSEELQAAIMKVGMNTQKILAKIYQLNPSAQVYIMGYYNPFPYLSPQNQPLVNQLVVMLNDAIKKGMTGTTAQFVDTSKKIAEDPYTYLPNPENIHLSQAGYKVVMEAFHKSLMENYSWFAKDTLTVTAKDETTVELNWKPVIDTGMISTYQIFNEDKMVGEVLSPVLSYEITDLEPNKEYHFSVQAVNQNGKKSMQNLTTNYTIDKGPTVMFTDITDHWAKDVIEMAAMKGIVSGYSDHTFRPEKSLTRAQATSIIVRALDLEPKSTKWTFTDLADYADSTKTDIQAAYDHGLVSGVNGHFMPNKPITRAQLALVLSRAYEVATGKPFTPTVAAPFTDIKKFSKDTQWAIAGLYQLNIATGDNGQFMPNQSTTRAHAAKMIVNSMEAIAQ